MSQVERVVVHNRHVVGIPTNGTAHMQHDFGRKQQQRGNLVGDTFGQMEVTGIESHDLIVLHAVTQIKIIRPHGITLGSDTEKFGFDTIFHVPVLGSENTVERLFQQPTVIEPVDGRIFGTVVNPKIHDTKDRSDIFPSRRQSTGNDEYVLPKIHESNRRDWQV